jgi:hypothetical protein
LLNLVDAQPSIIGHRQILLLDSKHFVELVDAPTTDPSTIDDFHVIENTS